MRPDEIAATYDQLAKHWAGDAFNRRNGIAQHKRALKFADGTGRALDVGCGSSGRIMDLLDAHGYIVEGLDISSEMLALAQERHPEFAFHQADICEWEFPTRYEFISAWDSIWHVPLSQQEAVLEKICRALNPRGVFIFTTGGVDEPGEVRNPCMGQPCYHAALGIPNILRRLDRCGCVCRHIEYDQLPESHVYLIVQRGN